MLKEQNKLEQEIVNGIDLLVGLCHQRSVEGGWYSNEDGSWKVRNKGEQIALIHSEISEAMEGERKNLMDDKLPHRPMTEVEMADAVIRIADYCGAWGYDLAGALIEKIEYNRSRADHKMENRVKEGGKAW